MKGHIAALLASATLFSASCDEPPASIKGMPILTIEEGSASANGTWKRLCNEADTGFQQSVLQFSGRATLLSTQTFDAPATNCGVTPSMVENVSGATSLQDEPKEVTWIDDNAPVGLPDTLLASAAELNLDTALDDVSVIQLILVIDNDAAPDLLYLSTSLDEDVTLDDADYPNELNPEPFVRD